MPPYEINLYFPDEEATESVLVMDDGNGDYILCEHPIFCGYIAQYGDLICAVPSGKNTLAFQYVKKKGPFKIILYLINDLSREFEDILEKLMSKGGYWQRDFQGLLTVAYDPNIYDPCSELQAIGLKTETADGIA